MSIPHPRGFDLTEMGLRDTFESGVSAAAWIIALSGLVAWSYFWVRVAQLHLELGDTISAITTLVLFVGSIVVLLLWSIYQRVNFDSFRTETTE